MTYAAPPAPVGTAPTQDDPTAPYGAPPQAPVPPAPVAPKPPRAPRPPRRRSAGFVGAVLVGGVALAAYGLTLWLHDQGNWPGSDETVGLAVALGVFAVALVGFGIAGLRAGLTGFIAVVLALTTWTASVVPNIDFGGGVGDRVWRPAAGDTTKDYHLGIGSGELDLTALPDNPTTPTELGASVGIGEIKIRIPDNLTVRVRSDVGVGDIAQARDRGDLGGRDIFDSETDGDGGRNLSTDETFGTGTPDVVVDAHVGIGQITIGKE